MANIKTKLDLVIAALRRLYLPSTLRPLSWDIIDAHERLKEFEATKDTDLKTNDEEH